MTAWAGILGPSLNSAYLPQHVKIIRFEQYRMLTNVPDSQKVIKIG